MHILISKINIPTLSSISLIFALLSSLFYVGNNTWLFTLSYLFLLSFFGFILKQRFTSPINLHINNIFITAALLLLWFGVSIFTSQIKYLSIYNFFWVGSIVIIFFLFNFYDNKDKLWQQVWPAILLLVVIWAIYGLVQYYYLRVPSNASFLNRNTLAALINLGLIPASGYFLLSSHERLNKYLSDTVLSISIAILFSTIFVIASRGASLSLFIGYFILFGLLFKHVNKQKIITLLIIVFVSYLLSYLLQYFIQSPSSSSSFAERMVTLQDTEKAGNTRFIIWQSLIPLFKEMPWYGFGLGSLWVFWPPYRPANDNSAGYFAHNDYMQITLEAGYPGIILLLVLLIFILIAFIKTIKNNQSISVVHRVECVSLFSALSTFAAHSFFTYNFYILPLLLIAGFYLGRFNQIISLNSPTTKSLSAAKNYFKPVTYLISSIGIIVILAGYFITNSLSNYYNTQAKALMTEHKFKESNIYFLKAQQLAPLMDNPFFSHADLLRRAADKLISVNKNQEAIALLSLAHNKLNIAEKLNPLRPQIHHLRGLIYERSQIDKAVMEYREALKLDPRFLFSRIRLATLLHQKHQLKQAIQVLYDGVNYSYPVNKVMIEYMTIFAQLSREAGVISFANHLESNIKKYQASHHLN